MNVIRMRRIEAIEAAVSGARRRAEIARKPAAELSDAEAIEEIPALCHARPPGCPDRPLSPAEEAEVLRLRALIREQYAC